MNPVSRDNVITGLHQRCSRTTRLPVRWDVAHVSGVATVRCVAPTVLTHNVAHATNGGSRPRRWKIWGRPYTLAGTGTLTDTNKMHQSLITKINIRGQRLKTLAFLSLPAKASAQAGPKSSSNLCPQGYKDIAVLRRCCSLCSSAINHRFFTCNFPSTKILKDYGGMREYLFCTPAVLLASFSTCQALDLFILKNRCFDSVS